MAFQNRHSHATINAAALVTALIASCLVVPANAQAPDDNKGRFSLAPVDGGFLRLDRETGEVAMCSKVDASWTCEGVEDRARKSGDMSKLESENKVLRDRLKSLETEGQTTKPSTDPASKGQLPTEEEVDKALDYVENIFKKFRNRIEKYQGPTPAPQTPLPESKPDAPENPAPQTPIDPKGPSKTL